jgi:4-amino-4-deoxy-L-arabinose transferase-like glycosyltransferase
MENPLACSLLRFPRRRFLFGLLMLAFLLRFGVVLGLRDIHKFHGPSPAGADAVEFNAIALNLASGNGYAVVPGHPNSFRAPGFPLFLAVLYRISYANYAMVYGALCLIGALTCLLTYEAARQFLTEGVARTAGLLTAVYLPHIYFSTVFLSEIVFAFFVALGLWLFLLHLRTSSLWLLAGAGIAMGYAALSRPIALLFIPLLGLSLLRAWDMSAWRLAQRNLVLATAAIVVLVPWSVRNYQAHHRFVLIATNGGSVFYGANNDTVLHERRHLGSWVSTVFLQDRKIVEAAPDEVSHDQVKWTLGKQWVRAHVADLPLLSCYKLARFWIPDVSSGNPKFVLMQAVGYVPFAILLLLGLSASLLTLRTAFEPAWLAVHAILLANLLSTVIFYGSARFRDSITPALRSVLGLDIV